MKIKRSVLNITMSMLIMACSPAKKIQVQSMEEDKTNTEIQDVESNSAIVANNKTSPFLENLLQQHPEFFDKVLLEKSARNVQVIYTEIDRDDHNNPAFKDYFFNVDSTRYFYPASTVKLPVAILALQRLHELGQTGISQATTMITEADYSGQIQTYNDPQAPDGKPNIANYIKKIFLVSDNDAFNRLYEFLGQHYINEQLHKRGYKDIQILHRLDIALSEDENRHTNPVKFLDSNNNVVYSQPLVFNEATYDERHDTLGNAHYSGGNFIERPMNFSKKNRINLEDLHHILRSIIFPGNVPEKQRFNISGEDYIFLCKYMSEFPGESMYPFYDSSKYPDAYAKFILHGSQKEPIPKNIRIFNKVGNAYGELIDIAYIVDFERNIEFFLSAAINCNTNQILNDDVYDYDSIGFPFFKNLGRTIYDYELKRKRPHVPDLSVFTIDYDR